jgi:hypothetical protein
MATEIPDGRTTAPAWRSSRSSPRGPGPAVAPGDQDEDFLFRDLHPSAAVSFSTHAMSPESVIALSRELYGARPAAYLLTLRGYEWEPNAAMTAEARKNVSAAVKFITPFLDCPVGDVPVTR